MTRDRALDVSRALVLKAFFGSTPAEAASAHKRAHKLIAEHDFKQADVFPQAVSKMGIAEAVQAAEKAKDVVARVRETMADPEVQKTAGALRDLFGGVVEIAKRRR